MKTFCIVLLAVFLQLNHALPSESLHMSSEHPSFIINGINAKLGEFPHQLAITEIGDNWIFCGAALISPTQAFTAGHCVKNRNASDIQVVAGFIDTFNTANAQFSHVKKMVMHPKYNPKKIASPYDFAILTFKHPLNLTKNVQPIAWNQDENVTFTGENCTLSGWGKYDLYRFPHYPKFLQKVESQVISNKQCKKRIRMHDTNICAFAAGSGACDGDSGGPMTCQHNGKPILAGVTSFTLKKFKICVMNKPSVYSRVSYFKKFIKDNLDN